MVANTIVKAVRRQIAVLGDRQIPVTASVGVALFDEMSDGEILACGRPRDVRGQGSRPGPLRAAIDRHRTGQAASSSRLAEAERIQRALAQNQLELYCQPILDLSSNTISQYELLVRLRTEHGELLSPNAFLYVAERFGTILSIDSLGRPAGDRADRRARAGRAASSR